MKRDDVHKRFGLDFHGLVSSIGLDWFSSEESDPVAGDDLLLVDGRTGSTRAGNLYDEGFWEEVSFVLKDIGDSPEFYPQGRGFALPYAMQATVTTATGPGGATATLIVIATVVVIVVATAALAAQGGPGPSVPSPGDDDDEDEDTGDDTDDTDAPEDEGPAGEIQRSTAISARTFLELVEAHRDFLQGNPVRQDIG